ncbi:MULTISPECIES: hypothetical protein [unclassified Streptomyces]|uniref:hypothetical protein n=1 Tax=unclassified Streptomyces TaxID=2593676 RepID=UPI003322C99D
MKRVSILEHTLLLAITGSGVFMMSLVPFEPHTAVHWVIVAMTAVAGAYWLSLAVRSSWLVTWAWVILRRRSLTARRR